ncbi:MAG: AraC family transcriptional regulator [Lentisphaerae bacterium]|nr:AraC family transcriptional regulator [Lentisphaerota bacterium]MCP4099807.1 AraC family transcriptional regulator [Lentisphaerota bacterium]
MENVRIYEIPVCKMVASKPGMFGDSKLERFDEWFSSFPRTMFPKDFLWFDKEEEKFIWYYIFSGGMEVPEEFDIIDFPGGLYAVATGIDNEGGAEVLMSIKEFIEEKSCFEEDNSRAYLGNIPTPPAAYKAMGYNQMDYYIPVKVTS